MRREDTPLDQVTGYVLAGGLSTRMGQDKALLELGGVPLIELAVQKLGAVVSKVRILGSRPEFQAHAPMVEDLYKGCGPLGGLDAALADTTSDWILILPVDMPFVPVRLLRCWVSDVLAEDTARIAIFSCNGRPQPALCMLHREVRPFVADALSRSSFKLYTVFEDTASSVAAVHGVSLERVLLVQESRETANLLLRDRDGAGGSEMGLPLEELESDLWFANLNTPEEFAKAQKLVGLSDTGS
jgi:molybdopterin-guanine dinucleotide biosynthesis protein A